jgi:hypothetical protein
MNQPSFPEAAYLSYINELKIQLDSLKKRKDLISWARLLIILLLVAAIWWLHPVSTAATALIGIALGAVFIRLIVIATNNNISIENTRILIALNEQELLIAKGQYHHLPDGASFLHPTHYYANDLDIFGRASVYQYINRTQSQQGNTTLAAWLLQASSLTIIKERQAAVKELGQQFKWRAQLQAFGKEHPVTIATEKKVSDWIQQENSFIHHTGWQIVRWLYPVLTSTLVLLYALDIVADKWFIAAYIFSLAFSAFIGKLVFPAYSSLNKIVPEIDALSDSAGWIESNNFQSAYLLQIQEHFLSGHSKSSIAIKKLKKILDKFDYNLNLALTLILNPLLLWNLQMIFQLEKWRTANKLKTAGWFSGLGQMEAISALAAVHFNHPGWSFPSFDESRHGTFRATEMGHPLIPENKMVYNSFFTEGAPQVTLITGSNMAGKSTFLRSTGVNMVLAMMGAPVCAKDLTLSPMRVISSMRVADNLEENTSTFYAELKKLKAVIECVNNQEHVFVLLDEILRGTNSLDRHTGSEALIKQLIHKNAVAMLATHDVELAQLQNTFPDSISNYHFDAQIAHEELYFDYKLKDGICRSINASILMKKIGIEL